MKEVQKVVTPQTARIEPETSCYCHGYYHRYLTATLLTTTDIVIISIDDAIVTLPYHCHVSLIFT
jgi:hypothetical protein